MFRTMRLTSGNLKSIISTIQHSFRDKEKITPEQHRRMFILHGTMETLPAEDNKGRSFTQILSSVCEENGGAVDILKIAE